MEQAQILGIIADPVDLTESNAVMPFHFCEIVCLLRENELSTLKASLTTGEQG